MKKIMQWLLAVVSTVLVAAFLWVTYQQANDLVHYPLETRSPPKHSVYDFDLQVSEVVRTNQDGQQLHAYFSSTHNGAYVMLQHGFKADRSYMFEEAKMLQDAGYGVLISSVRAHDLNDGDEISFGVREMDDLQTWYNYLIDEQGAHADKVGLLGNSMGAAMVIEYAAQNQAIAAVVAVSPFSSLQDTINVSVEYFTGLPAFPFAPMISIWAETILGMEVEQADATKAAAQLCTTPLFIMQGGKDIVVSVDSGQWIFDAACGEKELWYEAQLGHTKFDTQKSDEYARRVVAFFDNALL
ncbi:MAG: alpha/beta hydrolase [Oceanospirillaceae bacterium]|jgi:alpha-beta hydrolase superfamily lysophospholipase|nr:alpha/beta hydrolase [Oceanospirillaceae bacterium]MBT6076755.1 alpha/beta hydrolase [Oceanospirillaceae bacterium]